MADLPIKNEEKKKEVIKQEITKEIDRYKLGIQTVSPRDGTVDIPKGSIIIGGNIQAPFYTSGEHGIVVGSISMIYYLEKQEIDKSKKERGD